MGLYDRDYMKDPGPPRRSPVPVVIVILFLSVLLATAYFRRHPEEFRRLAESISRLIPAR